MLFVVYAVVAAGEESELLVGMKNDGNFVFSYSFAHLVKSAVVMF